MEHMLCRTYQQSRAAADKFSVRGRNHSKRLCPRLKPQLALGRNAMETTLRHRFVDANVDDYAAGTRQVRSNHPDPAGCQQVDSGFMLKRKAPPKRISSLTVSSLISQSLRTAFEIGNRQKHVPPASSKVSSRRFGGVRYEVSACHQVISVDSARIPPPVLGVDGTPVASHPPSSPPP
jgi:hypothetical protein